MKKRVLNILLCLCMVLMLCPVSAFAEEPTGSLTITVDGFKVGKTPKDCTYTFESTIPGVTFSEDDIKYIMWHKYVADGDYYSISDTDAFRADTQYRLTIDLANNGLRAVPTVTVNGNTPDYCTLSYFAGVPEKLSIGCDLGTPAEPGSLAITVDGFQVGNTPNDCKYTFASTNLGATFSADDILRGRWEQCIVGEWGDSWQTMSNSEVFEADTRYKCFINLDNNGLTEAPTVTVNGKTPEYCAIATRDGVPYAILIECELGTPAYALKVPFTITVKQGGSAAPRKTVFELELVNERGEKLSFDDVEVSGSVTTNGKGTYKGTMTFTGSLEDLYRMLGQGAFVRQVDAGKAKWTYDDTVWGLFLRNVAELADDAAPENTVFIFPATKNTDDGGLSYSMVDGANPVERMTFTNTYTKSSTRPSESGTNTGTITSPQTGDNSNLTVWFALLAVSAAGVMGAGVYSKRRRSSR